MSNKQIIIDDVDVSKCNYFNNTDKSYCEECCSEFGCAICNDRPNCYYKQLARKEQECEELKRLIAKQKNAKIQLSKLKDKQYKEFCDMKQILIEIKDIAEKDFNHTCWKTYARQLKQILQKISECEVENER